MKKVLFVISLSATVSLANSQFNSYVPQVPVEAYKEVEAAKQKQYKENTKRVTEAINDAKYYLNELYKVNDSVYTNYAIPFNNYIHYLNNSRIDYATDGSKIVDSIRDFTEQVKAAIKNEY